MQVTSLKVQTEGAHCQNHEVVWDRGALEHKNKIKNTTQVNKTEATTFYCRFVAGIVSK